MLLAFQIQIIYIGKCLNLGPILQKLILNTYEIDSCLV